MEGREKNLSVNDPGTNNWMEKAAPLAVASFWGEIKKKGRKKKTCAEAFLSSPLRITFTATGN